MFNEEIALARRCIEQTGTNLFLTGRAGTGKTTFLRQLKAESPKRMIVLAPTGVAAINAGGVTIHSFFQLPFAPFLPNEASKLGKEFRLKKKKIDIIKSLDLLVIDEVSMVRADLLDLVDMVMRRYRNRSLPFGGVQLLLIGDLQQLAPVIKDEERQLLEQYYSSLFFFGSKALAKSSYLTIELKHVYRQNESYFLDLLNKIRENKADNVVLSALNQRYIPDFEPDEKEGYIRLTTHNHSANTINKTFLQKIEKQEYTFKASINGNFPESAYPTEELLMLKEGAQVMFVKNDMGEDRRFYNGMFGVVTALDDQYVEVLPQGQSESFEVEKVEWTNARYEMDNDSKEIHEVIDGVFVQYPLRLAWAITVHKSQGLTFDKAIIDVAFSFAHGQVYVALSRCRTLNGLVLNSPINSKSIIHDVNVLNFSEKSQQNAPTDQDLDNLEKNYFTEQLLDLFSFSYLEKLLQKLEQILQEQSEDNYPKLRKSLAQTIPIVHKEIEEVALVFQKQLRQLIACCDNYQQNQQLNQRTRAASNYFVDKLTVIVLPLLELLAIDFDNKSLQNNFEDLRQRFSTEMSIKLRCLSKLIDQDFNIINYLKEKSKASIIVENTTSKNSKGKAKKSLDSSDIVNMELYEHLRLWRKSIALEKNIPVFQVLPQKALLGICNYQPRTESELMEIKHVGKKTLEKYGAEILEAVAQFYSIS